MTAPTTTTTALPVLDTEDEARCGSCPHPLAAHDPIGLRFCRATRAGDIHRGCVCRVG
jgi:hypothetical protein